MANVLAENFAGEAAEALLARRREREELLGRITEMLKADERVKAAWVFGSVGSGRPDDLSDMDIRFAVADEHIADLNANRQEYARRFGEALIFQEAPQNAPPGGSFLLALYEGQHGPQEVDWSWLPVSTAQLWPGVQALFDRAGLPELPEPPVFEYQPVPDITLMEAAGRSVASFWGMMMVLGKYAARSPYEERMGLLWLLTNPLREVQTFLGCELSPTNEEMPAQPTPAQKIAVLRDLAGQMESLLPALEAAGVPVSHAVVPSMGRYIDLIERISQQAPLP